MKKRLWEFIADLQNSGEERKRRWATLGSAVSMALIVMLWLLMFDANLNAQGPAAPPKEEQAVTFFGTFKAGSAILWERISSSLSFYLRREREIIIERAEFTFTPKDIPASSVQELPIKSP